MVSLGELVKRVGGLVNKLEISTRYVSSSVKSASNRFYRFLCPPFPYSLSGNTLRVGYHLCIRHILGTVFELYQSSENTHRYFHIINAKNMYRPSYAA